MSRENRRKEEDQPDQPEQQDQPDQPERRPLLRREVEKIENEPGYATPRPWSLRAVMTMFALMVALNLPAAAILSQIDKSSSNTFVSILVFPSPFLYFLYALIAMPFARRLAGETRPMRTLETLGIAALMYLIFVLSISVAIQLSGHNADAHDGKQMAGAGVAGLLGSAAGAALYPLLYRKLWMPRLPSARGGPRRGDRP
jgi:hypothetical protein